MLERARFAIALTNAQLGMVFAAAELVHYGQRDRLLRAFAEQLTDRPITDEAVRRALAHSLTESNMLVRDVIHRLRLRVNEAQDDGRTHVAQDLRLALDALVRLDRESQLKRPTLSQQPTAQAS